jgi:hypothetical protein
LFASPFGCCDAAPFLPAVSSRQSSASDAGTATPQGAPHDVAKAAFAGCLTHPMVPPQRSSCCAWMASDQ